MVAIISLLVALALSLLITRVATVALMLTGLSRESARFQARSAFTGVGFTTRESESIVDHPVRRRIVMVLMLLGNIGIATFVATLMLSFIDTAEHQEELVRNLTLLLGGLTLLWATANSRWVEQRLNRVITAALRRFTKLDVRDYVALLHLAHGFAVTELQVAPGDWLANKSLHELNLTQEQVIVLGIQRKDGNYIGAPTGQTMILQHDTLIIYGQIDRLSDLDRRRAGRVGDDAHKLAVGEAEAPEHN